MEQLLLYQMDMDKHGTLGMLPFGKCTRDSSTCQSQGHHGDQEKHTPRCSLPVWVGQHAGPATVHSLLSAHWKLDPGNSTHPKLSHQTPGKDKGPMNVSQMDMEGGTLLLRVPSRPGFLAGH